MTHIITEYFSTLYRDGSGFHTVAIYIQTTPNVLYRLITKSKKHDFSTQTGRTQALSTLCTHPKSFYEWEENGSSCLKHVLKEISFVLEEMWCLVQAANTTAFPLSYTKVTIQITFSNI